MPTLWKHPNGRWYALYREDGKAKRVSLKKRKKGEAEAEYRKWLTRFEAREHHVDEAQDSQEPQSLDEIWQMYTLWLRQNVRPSTCAARSWAWKHFTEHIADQSLDNVTAASVERHRTIMIPGWTAHTWNDFRRNMHTIYRDLTNLGLYEGQNPWNQVKGRPIPKVKKRVLTVQERDKLLQVAKEHAAQGGQVDRIDLVIALMVLAGLRKGEAIACRWEWFDWEKKVLSVFEDSTSNIKTVGAIPISSRIDSIFIDKQTHGFVYRDFEMRLPEKRYRCDFRKSFKTVCSKAGLDWVTPHILRHTFGSLLLDAGVEIHKVSKWMRHSSIKVTADIYYHNQGYDDEINSVA
jgi:integrase